MRDGLIFEWPGRHHLHLLLPVTIFLAAVLHAGLFFVFSIVYPRPESSTSDPARVYFVTPGTADSDRLEGLLHSADPAVFAPGRGLDLPDPVPPVTYIPQYDSDKPVLDPLPVIPDSDIPQVVSAGPVPVQENKTRTMVLAPEASPTKLIASGGLAGALPPLPDGTLFPVPQGFDPDPAVFLIAVRGDGRIAYIFQQHSSGNSNLDLRAADVLRGLKFPAASGSETWGFVTFQWGTDVEPMAAQ